MEYYLGEIRIFATTNPAMIPTGWLPCDGRSLNVQQYEVLFSLIGTTYGGDGIRNFNLPDLRGRLPIGQGAGKGLTPRAIGQTMGTETVTLGATMIGAHTHALNVSSLTATAADPGSTVYPGAAPSVAMYVAQGSTAPVSFDSTAIGNSGGGQPHNNRMPAMGLSFIMAVLPGVYPQRQE